MQLPVVTIKTPNGPVRINAADFNAEKHELWTASVEVHAAPAVVTPAPVSVPAAVTSAMSSLNTGDAKALVADAKTLEELATLEAEELAGKCRAGVLGAIERRRKELSDGVRASA